MSGNDYIDARDGMADVSPISCGDGTDQLFGDSGLDAAGPNCEIRAL